MNKESQKAYSNLEEQFSNMNDVVSNRNLTIQILLNNDLSGKEKLDHEAAILYTQDIARATIEFKRAFVAFRNSLDNP